MAFIHILVFLSELNKINLKNSKLFISGILKCKTYLQRGVGIKGAQVCRYFMSQIYPDPRLAIFLRKLTRAQKISENPELARALTPARPLASVGMRAEVYRFDPNGMPGMQLPNRRTQRKKGKTQRGHVFSVELESPDIKGSTDTFPIQEITLLTSL